MPHDREVVGDEKVGQVELALQVLQQVDDLGLDRNVQRRHRLVADDEVRVHRQGSRDADALALATGELVGVAIREVRVQPDEPQQLLHPPSPILDRADRVVVQRLLQDVADRHPRIERRERVLEDHLHLPAHPPQRGAAELGDLLAVEVDRAPRDREQAGDQPRERGLPATGLADEAQGLATPDLQVDAVDRSHGKAGEATDGEMLVHRADPHEHGVVADSGRLQRCGLRRQCCLPARPPLPSTSRPPPWRSRSAWRPRGFLP